MRERARETASLRTYRAQTQLSPPPFFTGPFWTNRKTETKAWIWSRELPFELYQRAPLPTATAPQQPSCRRARAQEAVKRPGLLISTEAHNRIILKLSHRDRGAEGAGDLAQRVLEKLEGETLGNRVACFGVRCTMDCSCCVPARFRWAHDEKPHQKSKSIPYFASLKSL